jgi:hypothetical protein
VAAWLDIGTHLPAHLRTCNLELRLSFSIFETQMCNNHQPLSSSMKGCSSRKVCASFYSQCILLHYCQCLSLLSVRSPHLPPFLPANVVERALDMVVRKSRLPRILSLPLAWRKTSLSFSLAHNGPSPCNVSHMVLDASPRRPRKLAGDGCDASALVCQSHGAVGRWSTVMG